MAAPVAACARDGPLSLVNPPARELFPEATEGSPSTRWSQGLTLLREGDGTPLSPEELPLIQALNEGPTEVRGLAARDPSGALGALT